MSEFTAKGDNIVEETLGRSALDVSVFDARFVTSNCMVIISTGSTRFSPVKTHTITTER